MNVGKMRIGLTTVLMCLALLLSCQSHDAAGGAGPAPEEIVPEFGEALNSDSPILFVRRIKGECLGSCPTYVLTLFGDRTLLYEGQASKGGDGRVTKKVPKIEFDEIVGWFRQASFADMKDFYTRDSNCSMPVLSDAPTFVLFFADGKSSKQITHYAGCYSDRGNLEKLRTLENSVEKYLVKNGWI